MPLYYAAPAPIPSCEHGLVPELPQVQALSERLDALLRGSYLASVSVLQFSALKTVSPPPDSLYGLALERTGRRGKFLIFEFGGPRMLLHLSQSGRVDVESPPKTTRMKGGVVRLRFSNDTALGVREFGTERKAALWVLAPGDEGPLEKLGPEPDDPAFEELILRGTDARRIHTFLRDQRTVAGIGRGYSDDVLHRAQISPYSTLKQLDASARRTLLDSIRTVLAEGLELERGRTGGLSANKLGEHFTVHGRWGRPCPRCGSDLRRISYESHEVTYCPPCQTGGKVLADRRLSKLLR